MTGSEILVPGRTNYGGDNYWVMDLRFFDFGTLSLINGQKDMLFITADSIGAHAVVPMPVACRATGVIVDFRHFSTPPTDPWTLFLYKNKNVDSGASADARIDVDVSVGSLVSNISRGEWGAHGSNPFDVVFNVGDYLTTEALTENASLDELTIPVVKASYIFEYL